MKDINSLSTPWYSQRTKLKLITAEGTAEPPAVWTKILSHSWFKLQWMCNPIRWRSITVIK